ncbi:rhamnogalacturonan acetylesterase, partial [Marinilabilia sp.]|uniref:rhamnogalacturonan acetylesterase n=1 Tax=Marinilabilia sp. TaxID=2021252 RepID=UPI00345CBFC9
TLFILFLVFAGCTNRPVYNVYLAGDSTMADKKPDAYPETGWGQVFPEFFDSTKVDFENHARNGRSSKSFIYEGRWDSLMGRVSPGSYVFIQFGHNDESPSKGERYSPLPEFKNNLRKYVTDVRAKGAFPILMTSVVRRKFNEKGDLVPTHGEYPNATIEVANELNVPLIDHRALSAKVVSQKGDSLSRELYNWVEPGHPNYPDGEQDDTHFSTEGARIMARLVAEEMKKMQLPLADALK